ncbi:response regulator [Vibrio sp. SCSIO 43135]|uniref:response regulator n=1 Tax=Vibrio sp. SCSIO 43135 TaxID=2819096 RepID=UPI002075995D|nr:response regulator [Vibrio sp. SCSIO 43135]USD43842.1 response regulator [Vibrio sp. SCSIO 43135]
MKILKDSQLLNSAQYNNFGKLKVLIVDDSTLFIQSIRKILSKLKIDDKNIQHASDTKLASWYLKDKIEDEGYDIIICSYRFKNRPLGRDFLRYLEKEQFRTKLTSLIVTDNTLDLDTAREIDTNIPDGFIAKPFNHNQFVAKLTKIVQKSIKLKPLKNAYFGRAYDQVIEKSEQLLFESPQYASEIMRLKCLALTKLKRFEEAIQCCKSELQTSAEWPLVQLVELYSLLGKHTLVTDLLDSEPSIKSHPKVSWILRENNVETDTCQSVIKEYMKSNEDHEKIIKAAVLHMYNLDYSSASDTLTRYIRHNRSNPLLEKRAMLFLQCLRALEQVFVGKPKYVEPHIFDKLVSEQDKQDNLYFLFMYILKNYDKKSLFKTRQHIEAFKARALYCNDNLVLILLALACYHLGLNANVKMLHNKHLMFVENDYLSIVTNKVFESLVQHSADKELHFDLKRDSDLSALESMTAQSPLNQHYHESFVSLIARTLANKPVKKTKGFLSNIETSISFLKDSYKDLGQHNNLVRLKAEYDQIRFHLR